MDLSQQVFVPLLLLDSFTNDTLFYQFRMDYGHVFRQAARIFGKDGFSCVFGPYRNSGMRECAYADIPRDDAYFCTQPEELRNYVRKQSESGKSVVFFSAAAALLARDLLREGKSAVVTCASAVKLFPGTAVFQYSETDVAESIVKLLLDLIKRQKDRLPSEHLQKIPVETVRV